VRFYKGIGRARLAEGTYEQMIILGLDDATLVGAPEGVFLGCKYAVAKMKANGGSIINMSSLAGIKATADLVAYNGAKAAVAIMTKSIAAHCGKSGYGIRCNSIHPGVIRTPILDKVLAQVPNPDEVYAGWVAVHPIGRIGTPQEIAAIAVYLASDESGFTTGAEFRIDGGSSI
jgi:3(or 17)beta-hydroxysteroid dehydrogenase